MKKILIPLAALLCACSQQGAAPAAASAAADAAVDTTLDVTADTMAAEAVTPVPQTGMETDATSGATAVPNETLFNGLLVIPPQNRATVTLTMGGSIRSTSLLPGAYVEKGSVLATLENPEFIALQQSDRHAQTDTPRTAYLRQQPLTRDEGASPNRFQQSRADYLSMRSRMDAAAAQLALLGIDTTRLLTSGIVPCLEIKAPISGYATDVKMNVGRHFDVGEPLCEIVDKRNMMLRLTAYEKDLAHLKSGERVAFRVNGMGQETFHGTVAMIGQQVNNENRSIDVYVRISGQHPQFRPGMYATARILRK